MWGVESIGERVDDRYEVVELLLKLSDGSGCVVGGFGFVAQSGRGQLDREPTASRLNADAQRCRDQSQQSECTFGMEQNRRPERDARKLTRMAFDQRDDDARDNDGEHCYCEQRAPHP